MARIAAIDFGLKRIGLAISDERGIIALSLPTVLAGKSVKESAQNVLSALKAYLPELQKAVIGLPLLLSGQKGEMAKAVETFAEALQACSSLEIEYFDERLSSAQADRALKELSLTRKQRSQKIDAASATLMLQTYLDRSHR